MACPPDENPCSCVGTYTPPSDDCSTTCKCLSLGYITVWPDDGVGPCEKNGTVSFSCFDYCACENDTATLTVVDIVPAGILNVTSINAAGLAYTTTDEAEAYDKVEITIKGACIAEKDGVTKLGDYTVVTIFIKDLCKDVLCETGETCNKCTGECEDDINLTAS
jgi:hypothetical protein